MSDGGEGPLSRWSRLKRGARDGKPAPEAPPAPTKRGGAAPVAGRRLVRTLPPLAGAEQDPDEPYAAPPIVQAYGLPPETVSSADTEPDDGTRELTPEEQEAVKDLPPIESLNKDSDFTPFLAEKVPEFIRRKALRVLWRSDPVLANLDGLNDYDEDFTMAAVIAESLAEAKSARKIAKAAKTKGEQTDQGETTEATETADSGGDAGAGESDDLGEADGVADTDQRLPKDENEDGEVDPDADNVRPPGTTPKSH